MWLTKPESNVGIMKGSKARDQNSTEEEVNFQNFLFRKKGFSWKKISKKKGNKCFIYGKGAHLAKFALGMIETIFALKYNDIDTSSNDIGIGSI